MDPDFLPESDGEKENLTRNYGRKRSKSFNIYEYPNLYDYNYSHSFFNSFLFLLERSQSSKPPTHIHEEFEEEIHDEAVCQEKWICQDIDQANIIHNESLSELISLRPITEYFTDIFSDEIIDHIVFHTNLYAYQKNINTSFKLDSVELKTFLGIHIYMSVIELPSIHDYWSERTRVPQIASVMSRNRFKEIKSNLHFNNNEMYNNSSDKYFKIRPIIEKLCKSFLSLPELSVQSIDEVMIPYKGTRAGSLRQYMSQKPHKWGFKFFARGSSDGVIHDMLPYQGSTTFDFSMTQLTDIEDKMNVTTKVVISLAKSMKKMEGKAIYADNWFSSFLLVRHLKEEYNLFYTGTVRENRLGQKVFALDDDMSKKKTKRGTYSYKSCNGIIAVKWKDTKVVTMISSANGIHPVEKISRFDRSESKKCEVPCPNIVKSYNGHMGGIDKSDMLFSLYRTPMRSHRWYLNIFGYLIDVSISNAWLIYKRECTKLNLPMIRLKEFRLDIADLFIKGISATRVTRISHKNSDDQIRRPSLPTLQAGQKHSAPSLELRFDKSKGHLPVHTSQRHWCKHYSRQNNTHRSRWMCDVCRVALCLSEKSNCFYMYHQE